MEFHKNMDLLRHYPVGTIHVPHLHVSVVEPIPTSSEGGGFFPCSEDVSDFHGPVCSSCFWLNHIIWPTSKIHQKQQENSKPYHAFGTNFPANSLPTMVGLVETWKLKML